MRKGVVFFLLDIVSSEPTIKIGFSQKANSRFRRIQNGCPVQLSCYGVIEAEECQMHNALGILKQHWSHGHWFWLNAEAKAEIDGWLAAGMVFDSLDVNYVSMRMGKEVA